MWFPYNTFVSGITSPGTDHLNNLGKMIKKNTAEHDRVYIFATLNYGYGMVVQAYSERKSPTKYFAPFSLDLKGAVKHISKDIVIKQYKVYNYTHSHSIQVT